MDEHEFLREFLHDSRYVTSSLRTAICDLREASTASPRDGNVRFSEALKMSQDLDLLVERGLVYFSYRADINRKFCPSDREGIPLEKDSFLLEEIVQQAILHSMGRLSHLPYGKRRLPIGRTRRIDFSCSVENAYRIKSSPISLAVGIAGLCSIFTGAVALTLRDCEGKLQLEVAGDFEDQQDERESQEILFEVDAVVRRILELNGCRLLIDELSRTMLLEFVDSFFAEHEKGT